MINPFVSDFNITSAQSLHDCRNREIAGNTARHSTKIVWLSVHSLVDLALRFLLQIIVTLALFSLKLSLIPIADQYAGADIEVIV